MRTTSSSSPSISGGMSGRGCAEILEVGGREHQHLAGAVVPEVVVALLVFGRLGPVEEVVLLALGLLREQVVGEADGQLAFVGELLDDGVVLGIVLEAAAGIDRAGDAEPIEFAHEMARRIDLIVERQLRALGQRRIEDARRWAWPAAARSDCRWHRATISPPGGSGVSLV